MVSFMRRKTCCLPRPGRCTGWWPSFSSNLQARSEESVLDHDTGLMRCKVHKPRASPLTPMAPSSPTVALKKNCKPGSPFKTHWSTLVFSILHKEIYDMKHIFCQKIGSPHEIIIFWSQLPVEGAKKAAISAAAARNRWLIEKNWTKHPIFILVKRITHDIIWESCT